MLVTIGCVNANARHLWFARIKPPTRDSGIETLQLDNIDWTHVERAIQRIIGLEQNFVVADRKVLMKQVYTKATKTVVLS